VLLAIYYQNDQIKEDEMGGKYSTYVELEGIPVGIPRKSDIIVLKQIIEEIKCKVSDGIQLAQGTV
jgi:hypothetical protein